MASKTDTSTTGRPAPSTLSPTDAQLVDLFRESAGLTPPPRTLNAAASRLVDLLDEFLRQLQIGWDIPPDFPPDRFVPSVYPDRDLVAPILQYVADCPFKGDAPRLDQAMRRFYAIRDWPLLRPSPGDDEGWREFQQRYVLPLNHRAACLSGVITDVRRLIIDSGGSPAAGKQKDGGGKKAVKRPPDWAIQAWRLRDLKGIRTQSQIVAELAKMKITKTQGDVSKGLAAVKKYLAAGNILPDLPHLDHAPQSVDPNVIDMALVRMAARSGSDKSATPTLIPTLNNRLFPVPLFAP